MANAKTHSIKNSEKDGTKENQGTMFPVVSIQAIENSLKPKIAFRIAGSLITEMQELQHQEYNLFDNADDGERRPVSGEQADYVPRMDRVQFWKGFADEHDLTIDFDGFKRFRQDQLNAQYEAAMKSKYDRDPEPIKKQAVEFTNNMAAVEVKFDEIAARHDYTPEFLALVYVAVQESVDKTREAINAKPVKYPFNELSDEELDGLQILLDDLESNI